MVSMETIKMKGKGVRRSWLQGANLFSDICVWGSGDFVCLTWLWSEGNLLQAAEESWCARCVCAVPGPGRAAQVPCTQIEPHEFYM